MNKTIARLALVLGALSALGPISIDMYLPSLPIIMRDLKATEGAVQASLMIFFVGLTLGQLFYGPLSDKVGRRPVIFGSLALFVVSAIGCALSRDVGTLIAWRFVQGLAGSIGVVIGFAVVRDLYTGIEATRLLSLIILVLGVSPIVAPLVGSWVASVASWHTIFWVMAGFAVLCAVLVARLLPETRSPQMRAQTQMNQVMRTYGRLLVDGRFMGVVLIGGLAQAGLFAYIAGSSFVFITIFGLSPVVFSIIFSVNAVALIGGSQFNAFLMQRFGAVAMIRTSTSIYAVAAALLGLLTLFHLLILPLLCLLLFVCVGCLAFIGAPANVLAMEPHGEIAGTASALRGAARRGAVRLRRDFERSGKRLRQRHRASDDRDHRPMQHRRVGHRRAGVARP